MVAPDKILTLASAVKNYKSASDGTCGEEIKPRYDLFVVCGSINLQVRLNIDKLLKRDPKDWPPSVSNELGLLSNGIHNIKDNNLIEFKNHKFLPIKR